VDSILVSASFLGWPFALFKVVAAAVTGILGGLLVDRGQTARPTEAPPEIDPGSPPQGSRVRALIDHGLEIIRSIWRWLVVGILASAAITTYVPADGLSGVGSMGIVVSCLAALAISLPLYVCATASVPIAYALVHSGLPSGAALVFLMAGPATNVATMGAIYRSFGKRVLAIYLGTIIAGSGIAAILFEGFFDVQLSDQADAPHMHAAWWSVASACVLLALLAWFALEDLRRWWTNRTAGAPDAADAELTVPVQGMSCMNCVNRLEQALRKIEGVDSAVVHLDPGEAIVRGEIDEAYVRAVIRETGFQPQSEQTAG
jgi:copper chaperone CopZ